MKIFAETERLISREILPSDLDGMFELDSDPQVHTPTLNAIIFISDTIISRFRMSSNSKISFNR